MPRCENEGCEGTQDGMTIEKLMLAWQEQQERIDSIVKAHSVATTQTDADSRGHTRARKPSGPAMSRKTPNILLGMAVARMTVCIAAFLWLICLYGGYVVDSMDLIPHIIVGGILLYEMVCLAVAIIRLVRYDPATSAPAATLRLVRARDAKPFLRDEGIGRRNVMSSGNHRIHMFQFSRVATATALIVLLVVTATPAYDGRGMSEHSLSARATALNEANAILEAINAQL